jgi:hypothetical protein
LLFHGSSTRATSMWTFGNEEKLDFDGDGQVDVIVPQPSRHAPPSTCPSEVEWDVFLQRGACGGAYAGRVQGMPKEIVEEGGKRVLVTVEENVGPMRLPTTYRYTFEGGAFVELDRNKPKRPTRCQVHPEGCTSIHCQLAGHPDGAFDYRALDVALPKARATAQKCRVTAKTRCEAKIAFEPQTGQAKVESTKGCGAAEACVRAALESVVVSPYAATHGEQQVGLSFTLDPR